MFNEYFANVSNMTEVCVSPTLGYTLDCINRNLYLLRLSDGPFYSLIRI